MGNYVTDVDTTVWETYSVLPTASYEEATDSIFKTHGANKKLILIKNPAQAGTGSVDYEVLASVDGGVEYDIVEQATTAVAESAQDIYTFESLSTHVKIRVKWTGAAGDAPVSIKVLSQSV